MFYTFRFLPKHTNAVIEIKTARPICAELFKDNKVLGRFMLRYGGKTIAAGVIAEVSGYFITHIQLYCCTGLCCCVEDR